MLAARKPEAASPQASTAARLHSLDALRGLVMIVMALDHTREFFHADAMRFQPEDLSRTTPVLFFTRWVTHLCAPVFFFAAGSAAYLWARRGRTPARLSRYLLRRGALLVGLDLTLMHVALYFSVRSGMVILSVLWALGWSMVALSLLSRLPLRPLAAISLAVVCLHNLADRIVAPQFGSAAWAWHLLHQPGVLRLGKAVVLVSYPLVPWFAVMALGFCFGPVLTLAPQERWRRMLQLGLLATVAFLVLRGLNLYGDPQPWSTQVPGAALLSFLRTAKYPPSLQFLLMTLGPGLLLMAWLDRLRLNASNPLLVFGRVPLFYFVVHFFLIHALAFPFAWFRYGRVDFLWHPMPTLGGDPALYPPGFGYSLPAVYLVWIGVVIAMYPLCLAYGRGRRSRQP